jgi:hypothetical protein
VCHIACKVLAESRKEPVLGDGQDTDPEVDANVKQLYKDWYTQPESAFWKGYAQIISSTSMPLDGQVRVGSDTKAVTTAAMDDRHAQLELLSLSSTVECSCMPCGVCL